MPIQRRRITSEQYHQLADIGVLGEDVELLDGFICSGRYPFAFTKEAVQAARAAGVELTAPDPDGDDAVIGQGTAGEI